jgi:NAD(P)-dependent dehydrogenase (short-subunit alcohol dehydrogenase family)
MADRRSVVITGASAGVGRAIALRFAREGARLTLIARSPDGLESVRREIEAAGGQTMVIPLDVADAEAVDRDAQTAAGHWGGIDVWINNAMVTMFAPLSDMSAEEFRRITEVDYLGYVHGTMAALRLMRPRNAGTIIQIGSALSHRAIPLQSAYCGAKFAIRGFTEALRSELIHDKLDIRLVMVQLPAVNTPQFDWARNVFPNRPQPVPPIFAPEAIADAVYDASHKAPRDLWLGFPTVMAIVGGALVPALIDNYLARSGYEGQFTKERQLAGLQGNLFEASGQPHTTHGRFSKQSRSRMLAFTPVLLRWLAIALSIALACVALAALR